MKRKSSSRDGKAFSKKFKRAGVVTYAGKTATAAIIAKRVLDDRMEVKESISFAANVNCTESGTVVLLNGIGQGNTIAERNGNRISMKQIQTDYEMSQILTGSGFVALVYDKQPNGAVAAFSDIFDTRNGQPAGIAFKNTYENGDRFVVEWIDMYPNDLSAIVTSSSTATLITRKRHFYKCAEQEIDVRYNNNTSTPITGSWYLVFGDTSNTTTNTVIGYNVKAQFTDV